MTNAQKEKFIKSLKQYKSRYLSDKANLEVDESSTRLMINYFLTKALGYEEIKDIKTEYRIAEKYADYVIQLGKKKHFIIEVKAISLDLTSKHLRQALDYAANEGIDWILLTNGRQFLIYRVIFKKPIASKKVFEFDLMKQDISKASESLILLSKKSIEKKEMEDYWKKFEMLEPNRLNKIFYNKNVVNLIRKQLKQRYGIRFSDEDLLDSIHTIITKEIESEKPKSPIE